MFEDMKLKFIIYNNELRLSRTRFHKDMLPLGYETALVRGGGEFRIDQEARELIVFGKSHDFGPFDPELVLTAKRPKRFEDYEVILQEDEERVGADWEWKVIEALGVVVAQGPACPKCGLIVSPVTIPDHSC
jgi:hypothetical protein